MKGLFWGIIFLTAIAVIGVFALDQMNRSAADLEYQRGQSRAVVIEAQGQARLDSAQAWAITSAATVQAVSGISGATLPWLIVLLSSGFIVMGTVYLNKQPKRTPPPQIIVQPMMMIPQAQAERWLMELKQNEKALIVRER